MRVVCSGVVPVALPPEEAFALFTPSGERAWAAGWDPRFPHVPDDETCAGTVFETVHGTPTTWVVTACEPGRSIAYARVSHGDRAGTVTVELEPAADGTTIARVTYDLTALDATAAPALTEFEAGYDDFLAGWAGEIAEAVSGQPHHPLG
jgi:Polyketide cyclase / dehydrase and lipid transport